MWDQVATSRSWDVSTRRVRRVLVLQWLWRFQVYSKYAHPPVPANRKAQLRRFRQQEQVQRTRHPGGQKANYQLRDIYMSQARQCSLLRSQEQGRAKQDQKVVYLR